MKPARILASLTLVLALGGCDTTGSSVLFGKDSPIVVDSLCATSSSVLTLLTVQKAQGKLTPDQINLVNTAVDVIDPICNAEVRPSNADAIAAVEHGLLILQGVKGVQ